MRITPRSALITRLFVHAISLSGWAAPLPGRRWWTKCWPSGFQDKRSKTVALTLSGDARDSLLSAGLTNWSLAWTHGDLDLGRVADALSADLAGLKTQGRFNHANLAFVRIQDLPGDFSLFGRISGQWTNENLDSSEEFTLGGPYGVRAWPVGEGR
ncbi:MAG: hypothetical protein FD149_2541, partial [Rhodospirillaceae bacterium]